HVALVVCGIVRHDHAMHAGRDVTMDGDAVGQSLSPALVGRPGSRRGSVLVDLLLDAVDAEAEDTAARPLRDDDVDAGTGELELQRVARLAGADVAAERPARGL